MTRVQVINAVKAVHVTLELQGREREGVHAIVTRETIEAYCPDVGPEQSDLLKAYLAHSEAIDELIRQQHELTGQGLVVGHRDGTAMRPVRAAQSETAVGQVGGRPFYEDLSVKPDELMVDVTMPHGGFGV